MSQVLRLRIPNPRLCGARPLGRGPSGVDLGLRLANRRPVNPISAVRHAEGWAEVRALASRSMGANFFEWGAFEGRRGNGRHCQFSHLNDS